MASVRSLGILEPSALPYLIAEEILPPDPSPDLYRWQSYTTHTTHRAEASTDEILIARTSVVWSRCGVIKRVLNLSAENESVLEAFTTTFTIRNDETDADAVEEALVIVLKSQLHILLLSGDSHILPLSFEAQAAYPCTHGFILQRTASENGESGFEGIPSLQHDLSTINESQGTLRTSSARPSLLLPELHQNAGRLPDRARAMPRTFSCVDPMSDLGLVVCGSTDKARSLNDCQALPPHEKIVYLSRSDEIRGAGFGHEPLCLAVTRNSATSTITIWHVAGDVPLSARTKSKKQTVSRKSTASRRKSSNIYGRSQNATLATSRDPHPLRQSFGALAPPYGDNILSSGTDQKSAGDLADQLGPEFEQSGVQTRSSRRVSSMLARTDLGAGNDRSTFNELAMGHASRQSMSRAGHRGESIGSFGDRTGFGVRRRSSFHAPTSILSTGTSFLDIPGRIHTDILENQPCLDHSDDALGESSDLRRDLGFFKLTSFSSEESGEDDPAYNVFTFVSPKSLPGQVPRLSLCLLEQHSATIAVVSVEVEILKPSSKSRSMRTTKLKATSIRRGSGISAGCVIADGDVERLLILSQTREDKPSIQLEAPWSPSFRLDMPSSYLVSNSAALLLQSTPNKKKDETTRSTVPSSSVHIGQVKIHDKHGGIIFRDSSGVAYLMQVQLSPKDDFVMKVILMSNLIFGTSFHDCLLVAFWEVRRWLETKDTDQRTEWTALVITLFAFAAPFLDDSISKSGTASRRKKTSLLRSSSGSAIDLSSFKAMIEEHSGDLFAGTSPSWAWLGEGSKSGSLPSPTSRASRHVRASSLQAALDESQDSKHPFIMQCVACAREFVQSPAGEGMIGPEGYLPIAISKERSIRQTALAKLTIGLHLLSEEHKLLGVSSTASAVSRSLPAVLAQLGTWLGWSSWSWSQHSYYGCQRGDAERWLFDQSRISGLDTPAPPFEPPSLLNHICESINGSGHSPFPTLDTVACSDLGASDGRRSTITALTPLTCQVLSLLHDCPKHPSTVPASIQANALSVVPEGLVAVFYQAIASSKTSIKQISTDTSNKWDEYKRSKNGSSTASMEIGSHCATKDYHNAGLAAFEGETTQRWDLSSEADRQAVSRALFQADRRFQEASKLVNQTRPPLVECIPEPDWSEADLLEAQKELAQLIARRTLSIASGRAMMHYSAREPLLTERVPIPAFSLQCLIISHAASEAAQPMTFSADKSSFTEEKVCWAFFHNGASAGLMVSRDARCVDTSWILYNKPQELTNRHAGFLLALGLNGHLRSLAKWVAFKYLTPKHTMTSIGLLLGLSASYLGTQDQLITRLLSVHVTRLLPIGAAELNLSPLTQTTGIMGIGLLYLNSQHRRMSEVMLSELENNDAEEGVAEELVLRDEGYRLAAGFSLGLINLGQGKKLHSLHDMAVAERLLGIAIATKNVNLVHVLDRATAGAVMAIAFIFMKTNDSAMASKIDIPDTIHQFDYVRPDIFLLRTLARHLIMWDSIAPTQAFVTKSLPKQYQHRASLHKTIRLATEDLPFFNILAGVCFALGLRYAGTQRHDVRNLLVSYLDHLLRLSRLPCPHYDARVTLNGVRNCLDIVALAAATVMAGSGDIDIMRRLRSLHGRTNKETPFGSHMAAHMALGTLFLGGGTMTFGTSNLAVASLCLAFYPLFPNDVLDNKAHLQALRHLWVLAAESRCLVCRDKEGGALVGGVVGKVLLRNGETSVVKSPGLLPELDTIDSIVIEGDGWWTTKFDIRKEHELDRFKGQGVVNVLLTRKAAFDSGAASDSLQGELRVLDEQSMKGRSGVPSCNSDLADRTHSSAKPSEDIPFEWLFELPSFRSYDTKEKDLVLGPYTGEGQPFLAGTPIDARLAIERGLLPDEESSPLNVDKLYELRALLEWFEKFDAEDEKMDAEKSEEVRWGSGLWLPREVINRLKDRVFGMMNSAGNEG